MDVTLLSPLTVVEQKQQKDASEWHVYLSVRPYTLGYRNCGHVDRAALKVMISVIFGAQDRQSTSRRTSGPSQNFTYTVDILVWHSGGCLQPIIHTARTMIGYSHDHIILSSVWPTVSLSVMLCIVAKRYILQQSV